MACQITAEIKLIGGGSGGLLSTGYSSDLISISETCDQSITRFITPVSTG